MKKYYSASEVSEIFNIHAHQLRYIEKIAPDFDVCKIRGRKYYTKENIDFIKSFIPGFEATDISKVQKHYYTIKKIDYLLYKFSKIASKIKIALAKPAPKGSSG